MKDNQPNYGDMRFTGFAAHIRMRKIVQMLEDHPHGMTFDQLAKTTDLHERTLQLYISYMSKTARTIHVGGWVLLANGKTVKSYKAGDKPDAPRPSVHADDACFLHQHPLHVSHKKAEEDLLPVRRKAKNIKPHADTFPLAAAFFGRLAA